MQSDDPLPFHKKIQDTGIQLAYIPKLKKIVRPPYETVPCNAEALKPKVQGLTPLVNFSSLI
jgi:hypothetical protein